MTDREAEASARAALDAAVAELYAAFRGRRLSRNGPAACTFCCASPEAMARIVAASDAGTPHAIGASDLAEYHSGVMGVPEEVAEDLSFLLPRILEIVAAEGGAASDDLHLLFAFGCQAIWPQLSERERDTVCGYLRALTRLCVGMPEEERSVRLNIADILELAATAGFDVDPVIDALCDLPRTRATTDFLIDLILDRAWLWQGSERGYGVPKDAVEHIGARLRAVLSTPDTLARFEAVALADTNRDPRAALRAERASLAHHLMECCD